MFTADAHTPSRIVRERDRAAITGQGKTSFNRCSEAESEPFTQEWEDELRAGRVPKKVRLGEYQVGWVEAELLELNRIRAEARRTA